MTGTKDIIISGVFGIFVILAVLFIGFKMGSQVGMETLCDTMNGTLGIDHSNAGQIVCVDGSYFETGGVEFTGYGLNLEDNLQ